MKALLWILLLSACAGTTKPLPPALDMRTLDLCLDEPGFCYQWEVCVETGIFGRCRKWEITKEVYDLRDPQTREKLYFMNFVGKVREKPLPVPTNP